MWGVPMTRFALLPVLLSGALAVRAVEVDEDGVRPDGLDPDRCYAAFDARKAPASEASAFSQALNRRIREVSAAGGGRVTVPCGTHISGTIILRSNVELHIPENATILGSGSFADYPLFKARRVHSQKDVNGWAALVYAEGATNVSVTGRGTIDGRGRLQPDRRRVFTATHDLDGRSRNLLFVSCRGVTVRDVFLKDPAMWNQHYFDCEDVLIEGVRVFARCHYNNDGCDIDGCRRVTIRGCRIDSADDAIVFKNTALIPCEDILVEDCDLATEASGFKFGTESLAGYRRVKARNLRIRACEGETCFDHPGWAGKAISAIEVSTVDGGLVEDIDIDGVTAEDVGSPLYIRVGNRSRPVYEGLKGLPAGSLRRVRIANLTVKRAGNLACWVTAFEPGRISGVRLENISVEADGGVRAGDFFTREGYVDPERDFPMPGVPGMPPVKGVFTHNAGDIRIENFSVRTVRPDVRPEF